MRQYQTNGMKNRGQVHRKRFVPMFGLKLLDRREMANHGVVDENVDGAILIQRRLDQITDFCGLPQIGAVVKRLDAELRFQARADAPMPDPLRRGR